VIGAQKAQDRTHEAQKRVFLTNFCAFCVLFLCFLCSVPDLLGKAGLHSPDNKVVPLQAALRAAAGLRKDRFPERYSAAKGYTA
jgi:hypothetical protein